MERLTLLNCVFDFLLVLSSTHAVRIMTKDCSITKAAWEARSQIFTCKSTQVYHCIQDHEGKLMETCMRAEKVSPSRPTERGCPWAFYREDIGYSMLGGNYNPCVKERGCPRKNDSDYQTNQLYKYPACLLSDIQTSSDIIDITVSTSTGLNIQAVNGGNAVSLSTILGITLAVVVAVVVIILIALGIILMWCRKTVLTEKLKNLQRYLTIAPTYLEDLIKKFQPVSDIESSNHQGQDDNLLP